MEREFPSRFAELLARAMALRGLSASELAERAQLDRRVIHRWLNEPLGRAYKRIPLLQAAHALGLERFEADRLLATAGHPSIETLLVRARGDERELLLRWRRLAPTNLPMSLPDLIGRDDALQAITTSLVDDGARLVTLIGPGGSGKSLVALHVAQAMRGAFHDGVCFVDLTTSSDAAQAVTQVCRALGVDDRGDNPREALAGVMGNRRILLVLDGAERVASALTAISRMLGAPAGSACLVTSREPLHIEGEHVHPVEPFDPPNPHAPRSELAMHPAVRLFLARAPNMPLTDNNAADVARLCARVDGLALGIELVVAHARARPLSELLASLGDVLSLRDEARSAAHPRQRTLRDTVAWSERLLSAPDRLLFARLAVFSGGWIEESACAVCAGGVLDAAGISRALETLFHASLVRTVPSHTKQPRFVMPRIIREYVRDQLVAGAETEKLLRAHAIHFLRVAESVEYSLTGPLRAAALLDLEAEHDNLRAALAQAVERHLVEIALRLSTAVWPFWYAHGHVSEGRRWLDQALRLDGSEDAPTGVRARALIGAGRLAATQGDATRAAACYDEGLALARADHNQQTVAAALAWQGKLALNRAGGAAAEPLFHESLTVYSRLSDRASIARLLQWMGRLDEALALARELGDSTGVASILCDLGDRARGAGNDVLAFSQYEESLALFRDLRHKQGIASVLHNLGWIALRKGDLDLATAHFHQSLAMFREFGHAWSTGDCLVGLAGVALRRGGLELAARLLGAAETLHRRIGGQRSAANQQEYERIVHSVRSGMAADVWESALAEGQAMTADEAVAAGEREHIAHPTSPEYRPSTGQPST